MDISIAPDTKARRSLPAEVTSFVGRRREIAATKRLLSASRLVTLMGPGGVGKSRVALRVADAVGRDFDDGVQLLELAELRDPSLLADTVAESLGVTDQSSRSTIDKITDHLAGRELFFVLDNCEHLAESCALFADVLLRRCPGIRILATSRQSLSVQGETTLVILPLPVPDPHRVLSHDALAQYDSVKLFIDRASAVIPDFDPRNQDQDSLARLCVDLDGIPLAIELAATWLRTLSLPQIQERLNERYRLLTGGPRGAPERQRTLRALVDWSHDLCSGPERSVWARASVFSGGFDLAAMENVCGGSGVAKADIPDIVRSLVDKSIVIREAQDEPGGARYRMLETLRQYGQEQLVAAGEDVAVRRRHRDWYAGLVKEFEADWIGPDQASWISRLGRDHANLRVALDFCVSQPGEAAVGLQMATMLDEYWSIRGFNTEARHWLGQALAASPEPTPERVWALGLNAWYALLQGDIEAGVSTLAEATELGERLGGAAKSAFVTLLRGMVGLFVGDLDEAETLIGTALPHFQVTHARLELFALAMFGLTLGLKGERERGIEVLDQCLALASARGELYWRSWGLWARSFIEVDHHVEQSEAAAKEALVVHSRMGSKLGLAFVMDTLAWVNGQRERHTRAATLFGAAAAVWHKLGASPDYYVPMGAAHHRHLDRVRSALGTGGFDAAFQHGYGLSEQEAIAFALEAEAPAQAPQDDDEGATLTPREREIAGLVADGLSNKEIAARLVIAARTVEVHVQHVLTKLGFRSRAQIAAWATARTTAEPDDRPHR